MIKLSICIPTFNRLKMLQELLATLLLDLSSYVEIIISDNGSIDGTEEYIHQLQTLFPRIHYFRFSETVEVGQNLLNVVRLAHGEYCWLMSDDDRIERGGLSQVLSLLNHHPNVSGLSVNVEGYDAHFLKKKRIRYTHNLDRLKIYHNALACYKDLGAWIGFWSALIIRRDLWNDQVKDPRHLKYLGYHHLSIITQMIALYPCWVFTPQKCVGYRSNNESFSHEYGILKRYEIDLHSYKTIGKEVFGNNTNEIDCVFKKIIKNYLFWQIVSLKLKRQSLSLFYRIFCLSFRSFAHRGLFWSRILPSILCPCSVYLVIRWIKKQWIRIVYG